MRPRDLNRLASTSYDVLVIGGGIHGVFCAYECASRGLHVALIDGGDIGSGTSFNHQKTVHGGLRSLQTLAIRRARDAIRERRALARIAPWLLRPLPFIVGTYPSATRGRVALRAAFAVDEWLGRRRNEGVEPELHLPRPRLLSRTATLKLFPGIRQERLTGGAQWYDYQMVENDRLTFSVGAAADRAGADLATYVEARGVRRQDGRIAAIQAHDVLGGSELEIQARVVVNATGARAGEVMRMLGVNRPFPLLKAMNLVTARPAADIALAAADPRGRMLTLVPWRGKAIVGTGQSAAPVTSSTDSTITAAELESFIADANHAFPALKLAPADVTLVHRGLVPAVARRDGTADLLPNSLILDHGSKGAPGAVTVVGAKYTTARAVAERVANRVGRFLGKALGRSRSATAVLPFAGIADHEALAIETGRDLGIELEVSLLRHLISRYAEGAAEIVKLIAQHPDTAAPIGPPAPTIAAEVQYVIRHELALRLSDIVLRRTTAGAAGHPGAMVLQACTQIAATELGWDSSRTSEEIAAVEAFYRTG
jgi:glycerol-3-phosphate dehydrogenase